MTRARIVTVLTTLVLLLSAASLVLALTRPDPTPGPGADQDRPGDGGAPYTPAAFDGSGGAALAAAVAGMAPALSYDVHDLAGSLAAATDTMTSAYAKEFASVFDRRAKPAARERKAVTEAVVNAAGLVRTQERRVVCLVLVDQLLVEGRGHDRDTAPSLLSHNRVLVTMVLRSDTWKIDGIRPL